MNVGSIGASVSSCPQESLDFRLGCVDGQYLVDVSRELRENVLQLLAEFPTDPRVLFWKCRLFVWDQDYANAAQLLQTLESAKLPDDFRLRQKTLLFVVRELLGESPEQLTDEFLAIWQSLENHTHDSMLVAEVAFSILVRCYLFEGLIGKKHFGSPLANTSILEKALEKNPDHPELLLAKGVSLFHSQDFESAYTLFETYASQRTRHSVLIAYLKYLACLLRPSAQPDEIVKFAKATLQVLSDQEAANRLSVYERYLNGLVCHVLCKKFDALFDRQSRDSLALQAAINLKVAQLSNPAKDFQVFALTALCNLPLTEQDAHYKLLELEPFADPYLYVKAADVFYEQGKNEQSKQLLESLLQKMKAPEDLARFVKHRHHHLGECRDQIEWTRTVTYCAYSRLAFYLLGANTEKELEYYEEAIKQLPIARDMVAIDIVLVLLQYIKLLVRHKQTDKIPPLLEKVSSLPAFQEDKHCKNYLSTLCGAVYRGRLVDPRIGSIVDYLLKSCLDEMQVLRMEKLSITEQKVEKPTAEQIKAANQAFLLRQRQEAEMLQRARERAKLQTPPTPETGQVSKVADPIKFRLAPQGVKRVKEDRSAVLSEKDKKTLAIQKKLQESRQPLPAALPVATRSSQPVARAVVTPAAQRQEPVVTTSRQRLTEPMAKTIDSRRDESKPIIVLRKPSKKAALVSPKAPNSLPARLQEAKERLITLDGLVKRYDVQDSQKFRLNAMYGILKICESLSNRSNGKVQALQYARLIVEALSARERIIDVTLEVIYSQLEAVLALFPGIEHTLSTSLASQILECLQNHPLRPLEYTKIAEMLRHVLETIPHRDIPVDRAIDQALEENPAQLNFKELEEIDRHLIDLHQLNRIRTEIRSYAPFVSNIYLMKIAKALCESSLLENIEKWPSLPKGGRFSMIEETFLCSPEEMLEWDRLTAQSTPVASTLLFKVIQESLQTMKERRVKVKGDFQAYWLNGEEQAACKMLLSNIRKCLVTFRKLNLFDRFIKYQKSSQAVFGSLIELGNRVGHKVGNGEWKTREDIECAELYTIEKQVDYLESTFDLIQQEAFPEAFPRDIKLSALELVRLRLRFTQNKITRLRLPTLAILGRLSPEKSTHDMVESLIEGLRNEIMKLPDVSSQQTLTMLFSGKTFQAYILQAKALGKILFD